MVDYTPPLGFAATAVGVHRGRGAERPLEAELPRRLGRVGAASQDVVGEVVEEVRLARAVGPGYGNDGDLSRADGRVCVCVCTRQRCNQEGRERGGCEGVCSLDWLLPLTVCESCSLQIVLRCETPLLCSPI